MIEDGVTPLKENQVFTPEELDELYAKDNQEELDELYAKNDPDEPWWSKY
jgi:hypothetical protein